MSRRPTKALSCLALSGYLFLIPLGTPVGAPPQDGQKAATITATPQSELERARSLVKAGRLEAASAAYRRALAASADLAYLYDAHLELGMVLLSLKKPEEARAELQAAVDLHPREAGARARLAQALLLKNDVEGAERELKAAEKLDPKEISVHYNLGRLYEGLGRNEEALVEYLAFVDVAPDDARANNVRSKVALYYENEHKLDDAEKWYAELIKRDPGRASAHFGMANVLYRRTRYDDALAQYQETIRLDPNNAASYSNSGYIYRAHGKLQDAAAQYTKAVELDPNSATSFYFLGMVYQDLGDDDRAMANFQRVVAIEPEHTQVHYAIGKLYLKKGDRVTAQREFDLHKQIQTAERNKSYTPTTMEKN